MPIPIPDDVRHFLEGPKPSVMATLARDGRPVSAATWYLLEPDGRILINMDAGRARLAHVRRDPRFGLTVLDGTDWYTHISLQCVATEITDDPDFSGIDSLSLHYLGRKYDDRERPRVDVRAEILAIKRWGA
jgi:PPOX class probable F420-dependent enzyme